MLKYPNRVTGVVVQNTPVFGEPISGPLWATELAYWKDGSSAHRDAVRSKLLPDAVRNQYVAGTREPSLIDPDNWTIDSALLARPASTRSCSISSTTSGTTGRRPPMRGSFSKHTSVR
jgi:hypothetical protein